MKLKIYLVLCLLFPTILFSQHLSTISGVVSDSAGMALVNADVILTGLSDTTVQRKTVVDTTGQYLFQNVGAGDYKIAYSYLGLIATSRLLTITDSTENFIIDTIHLYAGYSELDEVIVYSTPAITIKGDTTEFNISQIGIKPNATAEDALKKLAGVEVDKSGAIKVQGEQVRRVYVDGKRFFGDDPKMATQNLPADVIEKVQIFDARSDQAEFTGFDDGNESKTINIVTRTNTRNGSFGKGTASIGTDKLYAIGGSYNKFKGDEQLSLVGQFNNNNQQMFTLPNDMGGRRGFNPSSNTGQTQTIAAGVNYRNKFNKTELYGNYFYNNTDLNISQERLRQNLLSSDTIQNNFSNSFNNRKRQNHNFNFNLETKFDTMRSIIVRPSFSYQLSDNISNSASNIYRIIGNDSTAVSNSHTDNRSSNDGMSGGVDVTYRQRLRKQGRTFSVNASLNGSDNKGEGNNYNDVFTVRNNRHNITNQYYTSTSDNQSINTTLSYTEPLAKNQQLELNLNYSYNNSNSNRMTYNFDSTTMEYSDLDSTLTNKYENTYTSQRATLSYRLRTTKINFSAGSGVQFGNMESFNETKNLHIDRNYTNLFPTVFFSYRFSNTKNLRFNYRGRTQQPSISQLQPVMDNSNQLNIYDGNPNLDQAFNHSFNLRYSLVDRANNTNMFIMTNANFTQNAIVNSITNLSNGGQYTTPINMNGPYNVSAFFNYGFPIKKPKSNLNLTTEVSNNKTVSMIDEQINNTFTTTIAQGIRWNTNLKETFDINFATRPAYNFAKYSVNTNRDGNYYSQSISFDGTWFTKSGWITNANFDYTFYRGLSDGFNVSIPLLNASVSKQIFKNKAGEIKLSAIDLLNQNKSIVNVRTDNYIQQTRSNVLQRYFMLSFIYNLRNFTGAQPSERGRGDRQWGGPGNRGGGGGRSGF